MPKPGTTERARRVAAEPFVYLEAASAATEASGASAARTNSIAPAQLIWANSGAPERAGRYCEAEFQARLQAQEKQAREQGAREAEGRLRAECEAAVMTERKKVVTALEDFACQRKTYFERVEGEVVQLALAVARKILHRESQVDPLFLAGAVRVALGKVAAGSTVKLRVPENELLKWQQVVATLKDVRPQPEVIGDPALPASRCLMETEVGNTYISLEDQFREIERGMLDLLALRPQSEQLHHPDTETQGKDESNKNQARSRAT
jgi:flagellar biosynthesis/type III secretory pathway protein FliH